MTEQRHTWLGWPLWLVSVLLIVEAAAATFSAFVERVWPAKARPQAAGRTVVRPPFRATEVPDAQHPHAMALGYLLFEYLGLYCAARSRYWLESGFGTPEGLTERTGWSG